MEFLISLNIFENGSLSLRTSDKGMKLRIFTLEETEEILSNDVIIEIVLD